MNNITTTDTVAFRDRVAMPALVCVPVYTAGGTRVTAGTGSAGLQDKHTSLGKAFPSIGSS